VQSAGLNGKHKISDSLTEEHMRPAARMLLFTPLFFLTVSFAWADGNELRELCREFDPKTADYTAAYKIGQCRGIINGVVSAFNDTVHFFPPDLKFCTPHKVTSGQYIQIVLKFLNENPAQLHRSETHLILDALRKTFPCK
jgi:hypothetical protein